MKNKAKFQLSVIDVSQTERNSFWNDASIKVKEKKNKFL